MNTPQLPPMPEQTLLRVLHSDELPESPYTIYGYTAEQMQAYAIAAIQAQGVPDGQASVVQQEPVGWLYDWTHSSALGKPDEHFISFTPDEEHASKHNNPRPVFSTARQDKPQPLTDEQIVDAYCKERGMRQYVEAYVAGARFAEAAHGIKE